MSGSLTITAVVPTPAWARGFRIRSPNSKRCRRPAIASPTRDGWSRGPFWADCTTNIVSSGRRRDPPQRTPRDFCGSQGLLTPPIVVSRAAAAGTRRRPRRLERRRARSITSPESGGCRRLVSWSAPGADAPESSRRHRQARQPPRIVAAPLAASAVRRFTAKARGGRRQEMHLDS